MIMENPLLATFRHYDEWNRKNQGQNGRDEQKVKRQSSKFKRKKTMTDVNFQSRQFDHLFSVGSGIWLPTEAGILPFEI